MKKIPVFYSDECCAPRGDSRSPSMQKPALAVRSWQERGYPVDVYRPAPATRHELASAHDRAFVDGVLDGKMDNGFGNRDRAIAHSLPYTTGAMKAAAHAAYGPPFNELAGGVACAPVSGFHHAGWSSAEGFCTFNGLMVAALSVLRLHRELHSGAADEDAAVKGFKVGILDYDMHYGNGTVDILEILSSAVSDGNHDDAVAAVERIRHRTFGGDIMRARDLEHERCLAVQSVIAIPGTLREWKEDGVGLVLYQAGADPHINDPFGGVLTNDQLALRDMLVFRTCKELELPIAWCLAGGYQEDASKNDLYERIRPTLDIHDATMRICAEVYCDDDDAVAVK